MTLSIMTLIIVNAFSMMALRIKTLGTITLSIMILNMTLSMTEKTYCFSILNLLVSVVVYHSM
jgi:hypothetical protein